MGRIVKHAGGTQNPALRPRPQRAIDARKHAAAAKVAAVGKAVKALGRTGAPVTRQGVAQLSGVSRSFTYENDAANSIIAAAQARTQARAEGRIEKRTAQEEASWRERALNSEDEIRNLRREVASQRQLVGDLLGQLREPDGTWIERDRNRLRQENENLLFERNQLLRQQNELQRRLDGARANISRLNARRVQAAVPRRAGKRAVARPVWNADRFGPSFAEQAGILARRGPGGTTMTTRALTGPSARTRWLFATTTSELTLSCAYAVTDPIQYFYDRLADDYHLLFTDWPEAVRWQASVLDRLIRRELPLEQRPAILDCACGIGTQALGLALLGYSVHGTDISPVAVERARYEAAQLGVAMTFSVADMRTLDRDVGRVFDVVLAFDNSLPHLLDLADMQLAAHAIRRTLRPGGLFMASTRDYDSLLAQRPHVEVPRVIDGPDGRRIVFQVWDWVAGEDAYTVHQFILVQAGGGTWRTLHAEGRYRATRRSELTDLLQSEGFGSVRWEEPADSGYYQPVVIAT